MSLLKKICGYALACLVSLAGLAPGARAQAVSQLVQGFKNPVGLAFAANGDLYVANGLGSTVSIVNAQTGAVTTMRGVFQSPQAVVFDKSGNLYVANAAGTSVSIVTPGGAPSLYAGGFKRPQGLAFNPAGNLYVADEVAGTVTKVNSTGNHLYASGFSMPTAIAFDSMGSLFVADGFTGTITKITKTGVRTIFASGLAEPSGLACDAAGNVYVVESISGRVSKLTPAGALTVITTLTTATGVAGLALDSAGNFYIGMMSGGYAMSGPAGIVVTKVAPTGAQSQYAPQMQSPTSLALDISGNFYVANSTTNIVDKVTSSGVVTPFASGFKTVGGIATDGIGNVYIADTSANTITKVTSVGAASTLASGLFAPAAIAFDGSSNLYVAATLTTGGSNLSLIQKVSLTGSVTTFATIGAQLVFSLAFDKLGNLYAGLTNPLSYPTVNLITSSGVSSQLGGIFYDSPYGLAFDSTRNLYVANGNEIDKVATDGTKSILLSSLSGPYGLVVAPSGVLYATNHDDTVTSVHVNLPPVANGTILTPADQQQNYIFGVSTFSDVLGCPSYNATETLSGNVADCENANGFSHAYYRTDIGLDSGGVIAASGCAAGFTGAVPIYFSIVNYARQTHRLQGEIVRLGYSPPIQPTDASTNTLAGKHVALNLSKGVYAQPPTALPFGATVGGAVVGFPSPAVTFTPAAGFTGVGSFQYQLVNGTCSSPTATAYVGVGTTPPAVSTVSPNNGPLAGGNTVTVSGTNLSYPNVPIQVLFNGVPGTVLSSTATSIVVKPPAQPAGAAQLRVTTLGYETAKGTIYTYN